jgi:hypothetical protein
MEYVVICRRRTPSGRARRVSAVTSAAAALIITAAGASGGIADAATATVSPGDEIDHIEDSGSHRCTLGYGFTRSDGGTYGITAGHCNPAQGRYVLDRTTEPPADSSSPSIMTPPRSATTASSTLDATAQYLL